MKQAVSVVLYVIFLMILTSKRFIKQFQPIGLYITVHCVKYPFTDASVVSEIVKHIRRYDRMLGIMGFCIFSAAPDINAHIVDIRLQAVYHFFQITLEVIAKLFCLIHFSAVDIGLILHQGIITIGAVK